MWRYSSLPPRRDIIIITMEDLVAGGVELRFRQYLSYDV